MRLAPLLILAAALAIVPPAAAWYPATTTEGPLTLSLEHIERVTELGVPLPVSVTVKNGGEQPLAGTVRLEVIDDWVVQAPNPQPFEVAPGAEAVLVFSVVPAATSYAAHYPLHAYAQFDVAGQQRLAHTVWITQVASSAVSRPAARPEGLGAVTALRAAGEVTVDGDLAEWTTALPIPLGEGERSLGDFAANDFGAILCLLHDDENLYIGLRVTDDDLCGTDTDSRDLVGSDYVRVYLCGTPPSARTEPSIGDADLVLAIAPFARGGPAIKAPDYGRKLRELPPPGAILVAPRPVPGGYELEIAIPWDAVGEGIVTGDTVGFNLMLGDADGGRREGEVTIGSQEGEYWTRTGAYVEMRLWEQTKADASVALPVLRVQRAGATPLDRIGTAQVHVRQGEQVTALPLGWRGSDALTGAAFAPGAASRPESKSAIIIHPPYRGGAGTMWADMRLALPDITPIALEFSTAIRDNTDKEPPSDGVQWKVLVAGESGEYAELFDRFSAARVWEPARVDLSAYAGQTITLRLWSGPGPEGNTTCDSGYWGEPTLVVGDKPEPEDPDRSVQQREQAIGRAQAALRGEEGQFQWLLENEAGRFGIGWAAGPYAFAQGKIAVATADEAVVFESFLMSIDGEDVSDWRSGARVIGGEAKWTPDGKMTTISDLAVVDDERVTVEASMFVEDGAFKIRFAMPAQERDKRGSPRFTLLGVGPAGVKAKRVYAGFGNVIQEPGRFTLGQGGFTLSTRHIGVDYENGLSIVQAADVFPYRFEVDPEEKLYSLQTGHDATLMLIPSEKGAFAAARVYREAAGFRPASGVEKLKGRMCIDWWGGHHIAGDIRRAGAYGLHDSVFVKHAWQRWGYDYRLPDIYPPSCDPEVWDAWIGACKDAGMLCAVHDNYIDFYPDASDFGYKHILFNADGTPQRAWYNPGPDAQSYRWLPGAYRPWLERNIELIKEGFAPTAYFIDVFTALPLLDYYDQDGNFHTKMECAKHWGECFDYVRETLGDEAPQISEAGHDGLIGHLDGAQADHSSAKAWGWQCADAERTPWHDMGTHGSFILFAGGLGQRYAGGEADSGWASDDYLSNTVMGGRNPMATGPCTRGTVMTYWLQHDICAELARQSFDGHEFVGDDIHRQHTTFGGGGEVFVNRGDAPWQVGDVLLPRYGYLATSGAVQSSITLRDGLAVGYAHSPGVTFVDTRPQSLDVASRAPVRTRILQARMLGGGQVELDAEWEVLKPLPEGCVTFLHICHDNAEQGEKIAVHSNFDLDPARLREVGTHRCGARFTIPDNLWDGEYRIRYGIFRPRHNGERLVPIGPTDDTRIRGGNLVVSKDAGRIESVVYVAEPSDARAAQANAEGRMVDFGAIRTNGAFRLLHSGNAWRLLPLQGSLPLAAELDLGALAAGGKAVTAVEGLSQEGEKVSDEAFETEDGRLLLNLDAEAFAYAITLQ